MRKLFVIGIISLYHFVCAGQNLVPNPSFECGTDLCDPNQHVDLFPNYACHWACPTEGTTDILSARLTDKNCWAAMPNSGWGHNGSQLPRTGQRFAGLYTYSPGIVNESYREYLEVKLDSVLVPGRTYCGTMYVSVAEITQYASNNIGMAFHAHSNRIKIRTPLPLTPQILNRNIITDAVSWVEIYDEFVLTDSAKYLTIGNFYDDASTSGTIVGDPAGELLAYYFIDDVSVEAAPNDHFIYSGIAPVCAGQQISVEANVGVGNITWTTLEDTTKIIHEGKVFTEIAEETISYRVKATGCRKTVVDTVTIVVNPLPQVDLGGRQDFCEGSMLVLQAGSFASYEWQDHSSFNYFNVEEAGEYSVRVTDQNNCTNADTINVEVKTSPVLTLPKSVMACEEGFPVIHAGNDAAEYLWSDGSTEIYLTPMASGTYWVKATNECGVSVDSVTVRATGELFIPNVVTPNGDNDNPYFKVRGMDDTVSSDLIILNRWGKEIYTDRRYVGDWPRQDVEPGNYFYAIHYEGCPPLKGWIYVLK